MGADFSGYATKAGLVCSDGRTIMPDAFAHQDQATVPLVWQHGHDSPKNVLGHAILENRKDGVYAYAFFNGSPEAKHAKELVQHGDIVALSIYANQLQERSKQVFHGVIRELSLVLSGANPGAMIDQVRIAHGYGDDIEFETLDDEARIYTGLPLEHEDLRHEDAKSEDAVEHADTDGDGEQDKTIAEILETLNEEQRDAVNLVIGAAIEDASSGEAKHSALNESDSSEDDSSDDNPDSEDNSSDDNPESEDDASNDNPSGDLAHMEGNNDMTRNVFDGNGVGEAQGNTLTHDQFASIWATAQKEGSLKAGILAHAAEYGIEDINLLFPEARALDGTPQIHARRMEWVNKVLTGVRATPFAKVKSVVFDLTAEEARAKGYIKGNLKKDEVIKLLRRTTSPTTVYKKQRLDRDDVLDITDMDIVAFLKSEIRLMLEEEIARAILVGDGRTALSDDKIKDPEGALDGAGIRSILNDHDFYAVKHVMAANTSAKDAVKGLVRARSKYRGSGKPTLFISDNFLTDIMLEEDKFGRPLYATEESLRDKVRVKEIVTVDLFDDHDNLFAIMVNLSDYSVGANKGGEITSFEDFDIDFNQHKYLQETRISGGLTKPFAAVVVLRELGIEAIPDAPSFNGVTNTITIPTTTGIVYQINDAAVTGDVVITEDTTVEAVPDEGYYIPANTTRDWSFTYTP